MGVYEFIFFGLALIYVLKSLYLLIRANNSESSKPKSRDVDGFSDWLGTLAFWVLILGAVNGGFEYAIPPAVLIGSIFIVSSIKLKVYEKHEKTQNETVDQEGGDTNQEFKANTLKSSVSNEQSELFQQEPPKSYIQEAYFDSCIPMDKVISTDYNENKKSFHVEPPDVFDEWVIGQIEPSMEKEPSPIQPTPVEKVKVELTQVIHDDHLPFAISIDTKDTSTITYNEIVYKILKGSSIQDQIISHKTFGPLVVLKNDKYWVYFKDVYDDANGNKLERKFRAGVILSNGLFSFENKTLVKPKVKPQVVPKSVEEDNVLVTKSPSREKSAPKKKSKPKEKLASEDKVIIPVANTLSVSDAFKEHGQIYAYHMTHIDNIFGILNHGLLSHENAHSRGFTRVDISDKIVNDRRKNNDPIYHKSIHSYVPLYLNPKNPMSSKRRDKNYILFRFNISDLVNRNFIFTDGNASSDRTHFYKSSKYVENLPWDVIHAGFWKDFEDCTRKRCSEILVSTRIPQNLIDSIIVKNQIHKNWLSANCKQVKNFNVKIDSNLFF